MKAYDGNQTHSMAFADAYGLTEAHQRHGARDVVMSSNMKLAMVEAVA